MIPSVHVMKSRTSYTILVGMVLLLGIASAMLSGCSDPLSVETPRRIIPVDIDSILLSEPFISKATDTLFAVVDDQPVAFTSQLLRPVFYNRNVAGNWYLSVQGTRFDLKGTAYQSLALRIDAIHDTGTFPMQGIYDIPKKVDTNTVSEYTGEYEERSGRPDPGSRYRHNARRGSGNIFLHWL